MPLASWRVPAALYASIRQDLVLLRHGEDNAAAHAFHQYLQTVDGIGKPLLYLTLGRQALHEVYHNQINWRFSMLHLGPD